METPLQITFHRISPSPALEADVRSRFEEMRRFSDRMVSCRVFLDLPHQHQTHGRHFRVRIEIDVPGQRLVANHSRDADPSHEDAFVAVGDTFRAARRQLEEYTRRHQEIRRRASP